MDVDAALNFYTQCDKKLLSRIKEAHNTDENEIRWHGIWHGIVGNCAKTCYNLESVSD